jgi:uncharacterized phage protein (predicted DNA packaging)
MPLVDIDLVKKHLRVDFDDDDTEIAAYQAAAESIITETLDRAVFVGTAPEDADGTALELPAPVTAAILLMTGHLYKNRESVGEAQSEIPMTVKYLLAPYRVWRTFDECADVVSVPIVVT